MRVGSNLSRELSSSAAAFICTSDNPDSILLLFSLADSITRTAQPQPPGSSTSFPLPDAPTSPTHLLLVLALHVIVNAVCERGPDEHDGIHGGTTAQGAEATLVAAGPRGDLVGASSLGRRIVGPTLQLADEQAREDLTRLVAVSDVLEGFGGVLPGDI